MRRGASFSSSSACRSRRTKGVARGKEVEHRPVEAPAALPRARAQPLPGVWPGAWLHAPLRHVPYLLPGARPAGPAAGRDQVELVGSSIDAKVATKAATISGRRHPLAGRERTVAEETNTNR